MEHATRVAPAIEQYRSADDQDTVGLRVRTARGTLTSTQIEAIAGVAEDLSGTLIELKAPGELVLHGVRQQEATPVRALLAGAGLRTAETDAGDIASELPRADPGLQHVELSVPDGRVTPRQLRDLARLARTYADCELRITPERSLLILNMPRANISLMLREPLLRELRPAGQ